MPPIPPSSNNTSFQSKTKAVPVSSANGDKDNNTHSRLSNYTPNNINHIFHPTSQELKDKSNLEDIEASNKPDFYAKEL